MSTCARHAPVRTSCAAGDVAACLSMQVLHTEALHQLCPEALALDAQVRPHKPRCGSSRPSSAARTVPDTCYTKCMYYISFCGTQLAISGMRQDCMGQQAALSGGMLGMLVSLSVPSRWCAWAAPLSSNVEQC